MVTGMYYSVGDTEAQECAQVDSSFTLVSSKGLFLGT